MEATKTKSKIDEKSIEVSAHDASSSPIFVDPEKEKAALRKFDQYFLPMAFLFLVLSALDRSNVGNARVFGFDEDLGLKNGQFGNINTLFFVFFILFETPWVMAIKRFGPDKALGTALVLWSLVTLCTGFIHNYAQAIAVRMLLGACEAGVSPGFAYLFATIYPRKSTAKRIMLGNLANTVSGAFGGLFAYAIQSMGSRRGIAAWRWLFIVEGCLTVIVGGVAWMFFPSSPETAWFLNKEEKETMALRKIRDAAYRGEDGFEFKWIKLTFKDAHVYLAGAGFFFSSVAISGFNVFLPTIIRGLGYASLKVNYMTVPVYVMGALSLVTQCYFSDKLQKRALFLAGSAAPVVTGYLICVGTASPAAGYFAMFILSIGVYAISTIIVSWVASNIMPDHKRSVALPVFYSIGNLSGLVSSQLYPTSQGPRYVVGNATSAGLECVAVFFFVSVWFLLRRRNARKEQLALEGATTNGQEGDQGVGFEYGL
ncbi:MFS general substrate transporter [Melanomma pulvis-pyrius CBS 109.77]|uniref:MFS general substrate transporter n=1 Tax=Melanomma pulvis-pyrius CBS 109.77 TaxID=1314802 RepID=A0A6A6XU58_9PLEO|nr:MFS general substrate transporter [Melanomma pulvis-pyrius CBS 109.77]